MSRANAAGVNLEESTQVSSSHVAFQKLTASSRSTYLLNVLSLTASNSDNGRGGTALNGNQNIVVALFHDRTRSLSSGSGWAIRSEHCLGAAKVSSSQFERTAPPRNSGTKRSGGIALVSVE